MIDRRVQFAPYSERFRQMGSLHDGCDPTLPRDIGAHNVDNRLGNTLSRGVVGAGENLSAANRDVELCGELLQSIEVDVRERLFQPVKVQSLEFSTNAKRLFV